MAKNNQNKRQTKHKASLWSKLFHGRVVSSDFFARNWLVIALVVIFVMAYISSNYTNKIKREQVASYKAQSEVMKTERNRARSKYMGNCILVLRIKPLFYIGIVNDHAASC